MQSRLWLTAVLFLGWACAPVTAPRTFRLIPIELATWPAKAAFDSAATAGDTARIAASFAEDALLITAAGDSIRGRHAIVLYLRQLVPAARSADFTFRRDRFESCQGGGRERLTFTAQVTSTHEPPDTVSGHVVIFWKRDDEGHLVVATAAFSRLGAGRLSSAPECSTVEDSVWRNWRFAVTVIPAAVYGASVGHDFARILRSRGWVDICLCPGIEPSYTPLSKSNGRLPPGLVSFQRHWRRHVIAEVVTGRLPGGSTMGARFLGNGDYALTRLSYSGVYLGALLSYERWGLQLGVGPAVQAAHWQLRDSLIPYGSSGYPSTTDKIWWTVPFGILGDVRYHWLLGSRVYFAVRAEDRRFLRAATPPTKRFPAATVTQNSFFLGAGLGLVF